MSFNGIESEFLEDALRKLESQYRKTYPGYKGKFDIGCGITFMKTSDGKLTVSKTIDGKLVQDPNILPVDYENLVRKDEGLAAAARRIFPQYANV